jgi:hypothetical protein
MLGEISGAKLMSLLDRSWAVPAELTDSERKGVLAALDLGKKDPDRDGEWRIALPGEDGELRLRTHRGRREMYLTYPGAGGAAGEERLLNNKEALFAICDWLQRGPATPKSDPKAALVIRDESGPAPV